MSFPVGALFAGAAPVHHIHFSVASDHDVGGLQVAVDDMAVVAVFDGVTDMQEHFEAFPEGFVVTHLPVMMLLLLFAAAVQIFLQRDAVDELHCKVQPVGAVAVEAEQRDDCGMVQLGAEFGLGDELLHGIRLGEQLFPQRFDDGGAPENPVPGKENPPESACRQQLLDVVAVAAFLQRLAEFK